MRGAADSDIISGWKREAARLLEEQERSNLGWLTLTFAELAGRAAEWRRGLRGWNVLKSPMWEAVREEGRNEVRLEERRNTILRLGRQRFGRAPSRKQKTDLDAITDAQRLDRIVDRLLTAES